MLGHAAEVAVGGRAQAMVAHDHTIRAQVRGSDQDRPRRHVVGDNGGRRMPRASGQALRELLQLAFRLGMQRFMQQAQRLAAEAAPVGAAQCRVQRIQQLMVCCREQLDGEGRRPHGTFAQIDGRQDLVVGLVVGHTHDQDRARRPAHHLQRRAAQARQCGFGTRADHDQGACMRADIRVDHLGRWSDAEVDADLEPALRGQ